MVAQLGDEPPEPAEVTSFDQLADRLRTLRVWAGSPSFAEIARRIGFARTGRGIPVEQSRPPRGTVYSCFRPGRRRVDIELVVDIVRALGVSEASALAWRRAGRAAGDPGASRLTSAVTVLDRLPPDLPEFTGRGAELERVAALCADAGETGVIVAVEGMAGVGKSAFAVRAAHAAIRAGGGRDARLFVNLRGYDPQVPPADPVAVLGEFLRLLGMPGEQVEQLDAARRTAAYRRLLAGRSAVVLLDNAASDEQLGPLLPVGAGCLTLVTSRRMLAGASVRMPLPVFDVDDAVELFRRVAGADRVEAEPGPATRLAELCGYLPLELSVTAAHLDRKQGWTLADHVARLELAPRDSAIRPALATSYRALPGPSRRVLRLLALHPGREFSEPAAAALAGLGPADAAELLDQLVTEHLLQRREGGRYEFHDLIRDYAHGLARDEDPRPAHLEAISRLLDHYQQAAAIAMALVSPPAAHVNGPESGLAWLDVERPNLLAVAGLAAESGMTERAMALSGILGDYLDQGAH
ncbi:NB-ARC domain-containing protein [Amycolatopsis sp. NPDC088138]|uniref:NB-ARC domain-containing protein n=1 Tax=Amycolatopsis sp. NPDC088138 TaxID=3363938 RepID=UPI003801B0F0